MTGPGATEGSSVDTDLAILHEGLGHDFDIKYEVAYQRVKAELSRLRYDLNEADRLLSLSENENTRLRVGHFEPWEIEKMRADFKVMEEQVSRLREQRDAAINGRDDLPMAHVILAQLEAAEARCARLQQVIRDHWSPSQAEAILAAAPDTPQKCESCARLQQALTEIASLPGYRTAYKTIAREALAGPDTPADSQEDKT